MRKSWQPVFALCCLLLFFCVGVFAHFTQVFTLKSIECQVDGSDCPDYVRAELESHLGKSIFFTDFYQIGEEVMSYAPFLQNFQITKRLPNQLRIEFTPASARYILEESTGHQWVIDEVGYAIAEASSESAMRRIQVDQSVLPAFQLRERLEPALHDPVVELLDTLDTRNLSIQRITVRSSNELELGLPEGRAAILPLEGVGYSIEKLQFILLNFEFQQLNQPIRIIDLRYRHAVLRS